MLPGEISAALELLLMAATASCGDTCVLPDEPLPPGDIKAARLLLAIATKRKFKRGLDEIHKFETKN